MEDNRQWLSSMRCDLNDLQKSIIQAFNIDVRKNEYDSREIHLQHNGISYVCQNGIFMRESQRMQVDKENGVNPCFGEFSLIINRPK